MLTFADFISMTAVQVPTLTFRVHVDRVLSNLKSSMSISSFSCNLYFQWESCSILCADAADYVTVICYSTNLGISVAPLHYCNCVWWLLLYSKSWVS